MTSMGSSMMKILSYKVNPTILKNNPTIPLFLKIIPLTLFSYRLKSIGISKGRKLFLEAFSTPLLSRTPDTGGSGVALSISLGTVHTGSP